MINNRNVWMFYFIEIIYYISINEILRNIDKIKCVFSFSVILL